MQDQVLKEYASNFRAVQGVLLRNTDLKEWNSDKFDTFFDFMMRFLSKGTIVVSNEVLQELEQEMVLDTCTHREFMHRVDRWYDAADPKACKPFHPRLMTMLRVVSGYLEKHPEALAPATIDKIAGLPQFARCIPSGTRALADFGGGITEQEDDRARSFERQQNYESILVSNIKKIAVLTEDILGSIKRKDIMRMDVTDKIAAVQKLSYVYNTVKGFKPGSNTFQQINIYKDSKEDLEKSLLDMADDK